MVPSGRLLNNDLNIQPMKIYFFLEKALWSKNKRIIPTLVLIMFGLFSLSAQNIIWNFGTGGAGNAAPSTNTSTNMTGTPLVSQGNNNGTTTMLTTFSVSSGYSGASGEYNAGAAARIGALNTGTSGSAYFQFTLTPASGYTFTLTSISFGARSTGTGPQAYSFRTSLDTYGSDYATGSILNNSVWSLYTNSGLTITSGIGTAVTFRIYGYDGTGAPAINVANWRIDDLSLTVSTTLPILLNSFKAKWESDVINLDWTTATERSNAFFSIERSPDSYRFPEIGQVQGAGDSNTPQDYSFTDTRPHSGKNYYRLKQVDFDGKYTYSKVVSVNFGKTGGLLLSPMPTSNELNVTLDKPIVEDGQWQVLDISGRVLRTGMFPAETTDYQLNAADLPVGSFVFRLVAGQEVLVKKFWKG